MQLNQLYSDFQWQIIQYFQELLLLPINLRQLIRFARVKYDEETGEEGKKSCMDMKSTAGTSPSHPQQSVSYDEHAAKSFRVLSLK